MTIPWAGKKNLGFTALKLLKEFVRKLIASASAGALFSKKPTVHFYPENHECPTCGSRLHVRKTHTKTVVTMDIGAFLAKETVLFCPQDQTPFISEKLGRLVPEGGTFGFDVIVEVGLALFVHCRNNQEVMKELAAKNVFVSEREISYLGRKFICGSIPRRLPRGSSFPGRQIDSLCCRIARPLQSALW